MHEEGVKKIESLSRKGWFRKALKVAGIIGSVAEIVVTSSLKLPIKVVKAIACLSVVTNIVKVVAKEAPEDE